MSWTLILTVAGHVLALDSGMSAEDCAAALAAPLPAVVVVISDDGADVPAAVLTCELEGGAE